MGEARGQVTEQARNGQRKAADRLRALAEELREMADRGERSGLASDLAGRRPRAAARRSGRPPRARRPPRGGPPLRPPPPGVFLLGAAFAGMLAGRLTRGVVDANRQDEDPAPPDRLGYPPAADRGALRRPDTSRRHLPSARRSARGPVAPPP